MSDTEIYDRQHEMRLRVARMLREIAVLLRASGEMRFKVRAYERAAHAIEHSTRDLGELIDRHELASLPGIGARLASTIEEFCRTGESRLLTRLRAQFPPGTAALINIPHLGVKKIATLHRVLEITNRDDLKEACEAGRVRELPGFGPNIERKILTALTHTDGESSSQYLLVTALSAADLLLGWLQSSPSVHRADIVGAVRRAEEIVTGVELVAATSDVNALLDHFLRYPNSVGTVSPERTTRPCGCSEHAGAGGIFRCGASGIVAGDGFIRRCRRWPQMKA